MGGDLITTIVMMIVFIAIIYFMMLRPQRKAEEAKKELLATLKIGDSVKTSSGFYGTILGIEGDVVIVEFGNDRHCRIPMDINFIEDVDRPEEDAE